MSNTKLIETGSSTNNYYQSINQTYKKLFHKLLMLHYPFYQKQHESLEERQVNLTKHCVDRLGDIKDKEILEVGCGNGTQSIYIHENFKPAKTIGIDINTNNIELANDINGAHHNLEFIVDDAQQLKQIPDNSVDALLCIESAFHYPDKDSFMKQIHRVLKPTGKFIIADILSVSYKNRYFMERWKRKMSYYHWTKDHYIENFKKNKLSVQHSENITEAIKNGYNGYGSWVKRKDFNTIFSFFWFKLFIFVQVKINILLLKKRRKYYIFVGKPLSK